MNALTDIKLLLVKLFKARVRGTERKTVTIIPEVNKEGKTAVSRQHHVMRRINFFAGPHSAFLPNVF